MVYEGITTEEGLKLLQTPECVKVSAGMEHCNIHWFIHKNLLTKHSKFFASALNSSFCESSSNSIAFRKDDPDIVQIFVQWLYCGSNVDKIMELTGDVTNVDMWVFGDKIQCPAFQNFTMANLVRMHENHSIDQNMIFVAYSYSVRGSKLRQYIMNQFWWDIRPSNNRNKQRRYRELIEDIDEFGEEFFQSALSRRKCDQQHPSDCEDKYMVTVDGS
ncbi:hypothetical protein ACLMJK_008021 [Lecanora helva]